MGKGPVVEFRCYKLLSWDLFEEINYTQSHRKVKVIGRSKSVNVKALLSYFCVTTDYRHSRFPILLISNSFPCKMNFVLQSFARKNHASPPKYTILSVNITCKRIKGHENICIFNYVHLK